MTPRHRHPRNLRPGTARGLTLVEMMCSLAILAILLAGMLPMARAMHTRLSLEGVASLLETDVQYARSLAMARSSAVRLSVQALDDGGTCYLLHTGPAHACQCAGAGQARCDSGAELLRLAEQPGGSGVQLASVGRSIAFSAGKGTVTPTATLVVRSDDGQVIHQIVNIVGRTRSCSPTGLTGFRACS